MGNDMSIKAVLDTSPHCPECAFKHLSAVHGIKLSHPQLRRPYLKNQVERDTFAHFVLLRRIQILAQESLLPEYRRNIPIAVALCAAAEPMMSSSDVVHVRLLRKRLMFLLPYESDFQPESWLTAANRLRTTLDQYSSFLVDIHAYDPMIGTPIGVVGNAVLSPEELWALVDMTAHVIEFCRECPRPIWRRLMKLFPVTLEHQYPDQGMLDGLLISEGIPTGMLNMCHEAM